ncbi:hypothetical protein [Aeromicrobium sp. UC242_57]|uniref:hypothetical protein n=1 Tax=Aeromicrobium sp. UC242_57 TaxID=3374624 RepID=UPI0037B399E9
MTIVIGVSCSAVGCQVPLSLPVEGEGQEHLARGTSMSLPVRPALQAPHPDGMTALGGGHDLDLAVAPRRQVGGLSRRLREVVQRRQQSLGRLALLAVGIAERTDPRPEAVPPVPTLDECALGHQRAQQVVRRGKRLAQEGADVLGRHPELLSLRRS